MEEVVDEARPSELEGGSEEDEVEVVGEDFEVSGERRLLLLLRTESDSKRDHECLLDEEHDIADGEKEEHTHEEDVLPLSWALRTLVCSSPGVVWITLVTESASIAWSAPSLWNVIGVTGSA